MDDKDTPARRAMIEAIENFYREGTEGGLLTDYVVACAGVAMTATRATEYAFVTSDSPIHSIIGLTELTKDHVQTYLYEEDEGDDEE